LADQLKPKRTGKDRARDANNHGPCPTGGCKHPPVDHRPIAASRQHFCYHRDCMQTCAER
jgi:hypothetical protein